MTRLRIAETAEGWTKVVVWPEPIEKVFQSMIARFEPWVTTVDEPLGLVMVADPAATVPPVGLPKSDTGIPAPVAINAITRENRRPICIGRLRRIVRKRDKESYVAVGI